MCNPPLPRSSPEEARTLSVLSLLAVVSVLLEAVLDRVGAHVVHLVTHLLSHAAGEEFEVEVDTSEREGGGRAG